MSIKFSTITRGSGKLFVRMESKLPAARWEASGQTTAGDAVPAKVHIAPDGSKTLVAAALGVDQRVAVRALDEQGAVLEQAERLFAERTTKARSKANTLLHNPHVDSLRNCDAQSSIRQIDVRLLRVVPTDAGHDLLHIRVFLPVCSEPSRQAPVELKVLGPDGKSVAISAPIQIGELLEEYPRHPGVSYRVDVYSVPVAPGSTWLCLYAICPNSGLEGNFVCIQPHETPTYHVSWYQSLRVKELTGFFATWNIAPMGYEGADPGFEAWLGTVRATDTDLAVQRETHTEFEVQPVFSLVAVLDGMTANALQELVATVLAQSYPRFELLLALSASADAALTAAAEGMALEDGRIRVVALDPGSKAADCAALQASLDSATGDFFCLLGQGARLESDLLYCYTEALNSYPTTDLLYCNEDLLFEGHYVLPFYKPDWSPLFLETNNYVGKLLAVRTSLAQQLAWPAPELDGAQEYALVLAASEQARNIHHVRRFLYHTQTDQLFAPTDPHTLEAERKALQGHFDRLGLTGIRLQEVPSAPPCHLPVYEQVQLPSVSAIIAPGPADLVAKTAESLEALHWDQLEITSCATGTAAGSAAELINDAVAHSSGDYLLLLEAGVIVKDEASLAQLLAVAQRPDVSLVSPKTILPDGCNLHNGLAFHEGVAFTQNRFFYQSTIMDHALTVLPHEASATTPHCLVLSRASYDALGGVSPQAPTGLWSVQLCLDAQAQGLPVVQCSQSHVVGQLGHEDLSIDDEGVMLEAFTQLTYLLRDHAKAVFKPDRFYRPLD